MDDRTAVKRELPAMVDSSAYRGGTRLKANFPTIHYLRQKARRRIPHFAFEYGDGGAGADGGIARNWAALDAVELVPRYGVMNALPPLEVTLFGRPSHGTGFSLFNRIKGNNRRCLCKSIPFQNCKAKGFEVFHYLRVKLCAPACGEPELLPERPVHRFEDNLAEVYVEAPPEITGGLQDPEHYFRQRS